MPRKNRKMKNPPAVLVISAEQRFHTEKPRYNAHQTGTGAHKSAKAYRRNPKHRGQENY
jgi:hypothetical protein